jgi:hypothetical protein
MKKLRQLLCLTVCCALADCASEEPSQPVRESSPAPEVSAGAGSISAVDIPSIGCDPSITNAVSCGGVACAPQPVDLCIASCCTTGDKCGVRMTTAVNGMRISDVCNEAGTVDPACPKTTFGTVTADGCCDMTGHCGQLTLGMCISLAVGPSCGRDSREADAGP